MENWNERLIQSVKVNDSSLCIGLDPEIDKLPKKFHSSSTPFLDFNKEIIDATFDLVCAYKPQSAHYIAFGREAELEKTIAYIKEKSSNLLIILDSKRGDIGNTAEYYAKEAFCRYKCHATTVSPYMGFDSIKPFLAQAELGAFILCRTSNQSSGDFQNLVLKDSNEPLFLEVAKRVSKNWNSLNNCGLVMGATYPDDLKRVRSIVGPRLPFLVPGIGAQGGSIEEVVKASYTGPGSLIINSSRAILYKDESDSFAITSREQALKLNRQIKAAISEFYTR